MARKQNPAIRDFILRNVDENPNSVASLAAKKFGLTRAGIGRYMDRLIEEGFLVGEGKTRSRHYQLKPLVDFLLPLERGVMPPWTEDTVWRDHILPLIKNVPHNIIDICQYGFTEMLNNVIDHSESPDAFVSYTQTYARIILYVGDHGLGIFNKIQQDFNLADPRTALLELSKGKITSDKRRHSGEGIYFTSRMFNKFSILSGHLFYARLRRDDDDWLIESEEKKQETKGTFVTMEIVTNANWTMQGVFDKYQGDDIYFRKTHVPIALGRYPGEQLVSRSQAKRILARFTDFSEVMLDFKGVAEIGQPFADEIFRVFKEDHPDVKLLALNTNKNIDKMIQYVQSENSTLPLPLPGPKS
jgi:anti-sigma regulatory factor (Ser/Thr protein kinase)